MGIIIKEKNEQARISGLKAFIFILVFIMVLNLAVAAINRLQPIMAGTASMLLVLAVMAITYKVMNRKVVEYNYILTDDGLVFEKVMGRREKRVLQIPFDDMLFFKPAGEAGKCDRYHHFLCIRDHPDRFVVGFTERGKTRGVVFCPGPNMVKAMRSRLGGRGCVEGNGIRKG